MRFWSSSVVGGYLITARSCLACLLRAVCPPLSQSLSGCVLSSYFFYLVLGREVNSGE